MTCVMNEIVNKKRPIERSPKLDEGMQEKDGLWL